MIKPNNRFEFARVARPTRKRAAPLLAAQAGALGIWMELSLTDRIWNRAALRAGGATPREGDQALTALLTVHGMVMNGGIDHALEVLERTEFEAGISGFRYFGLIEVAATLEAACVADIRFEVLNAQYGALIPDDGCLVRAFEQKYAASPNAFSPLEENRSSDA